MDDTPEALRRAIASALGDAAMAERARRFAAGIDLGAGMKRAVDVLEGLGRG